MYVDYSERELDHLRARDKTLGAVIDQIGMIQRPADKDLFESVVHRIVGQQISVHAQRAIWERLTETVGVVDAQNILAIPADELRSVGLSARKTDYIRDFADKVHTGAFDIEAVRTLPDDEVIAALVGLKGIGVWTAEMVMMFALGRKDVVSYGDVAILRGMRMVYRHREITEKLFTKYRKRYAPYGTVASLYLWAVAGGAIEGVTDPRPHK